jgi:hypothetical protein
MEKVLRRSSLSFPDLRWLQLNAACVMAIGLGLLRQDSGENEVFERWAKRKEMAITQSSKA